MNDDARRFDRRAWLQLAAAGAVSTVAGSRLVWPHSDVLATGTSYEGSDEELMDEIQQSIYQFFWNETDPRTGLIKDRSYLNGNDRRTMASIAATGFGLAALCSGDLHGYGKTPDIANRVRTTLRFIDRELPNVHGFYYHFVDISTGQRWRRSELSSVDTALLMCSVLSARQHFVDQEIQDLATKIYERVEWPWMLNGSDTFAMGWFPEGGFISSRWDHYSECMMIYLLAVGSPTHPVAADTWRAWTRPTTTYDGITYIAGRDPLFTHQYSHAWFDFRSKRDAYTDYFENSVLATKAHKLFCLSLSEHSRDYGEELWGISASDSANGYTAWGGPPSLGQLDGTIVPCATGGSVPFLYQDCLRVLRTIRGRYQEKAWGKYGFADAFNPLTGWYDTDVVGIDLGITMLMIENHRTEHVWKTFMKNAEAGMAMKRVGFQRT